MVGFLLEVVKEKHQFIKEMSLKIRTDKIDSEILEDFHRMKNDDRFLLLCNEIFYNDEFKSEIEEHVHNNYTVFLYEGKFNHIKCKDEYIVHSYRQYNDCDKFLILTNLKFNKNEIEKAFDNDKVFYYKNKKLC
jgi:hypothetical protein